MILVSQDKETIINFDNITEIAQEDGEIGITNDILNDDFQVIAIYKTEERAKEVLKEIVNKYRQWNVDNNKAVSIIPKVYEFPKE